ncbi:MAG: hypothetical protein ACP5NK_07885 [Thermoplasmata archaeon]
MIIFCSFIIEKISPATVSPVGLIFAFMAVAYTGFHGGAISSTLTEMDEISGLMDTSVSTISLAASFTMIDYPNVSMQGMGIVNTIVNKANSLIVTSIYLEVGITYFFSVDGLIPYVARMPFEKVT